MLLDITDKQRTAILTWLVGGSAAIAYLIGKRLFLQGILFSMLFLLLTQNRYKWLYILYKTVPRDLTAACRFLELNVRLYMWERRGLTVARVFQENVAKHPHKVAFHFEDTKWTFKQVDEYSNQIAAFFKHQGLVRGDAVSLLMESRPQYVCMWLGLSKIGVVAALINTNLRRDVLLHSIRAADSKAIIVGSELAEAITEVRESNEEVAGLSLYQFRDESQLDQTLAAGAVDLRAGIRDMPTSSPEKEMSMGLPKDKLIYIYTSGTTGMPKAAVITNLRYMLIVIGVKSMLQVSSDDVIYNPLPLYHSAGGMIGVGQALLCGSTVALRKRFSATNFFPDCIKYKCTVAQYIGEICRYLLSTPEKPDNYQHTIRLMFGNGLRPQIWSQFVRRFRVPQIGEFYGATEGNSNLVNIDSTEGAVGFLPRYTGLLYPVSLLRCDEETGEPIRNEAGRCIRCLPGETGVFVGKINPAKAVNAFSGYADREASEKKILKNVFREGDMYFNSGDILIMDMLGYFYFKDRTGDTFRWRGENVATSEVEAVISNVAGLKDCVVYGVEIPNIEGRAGMAAIVDPDRNLNMDALGAGIRASLPAYARPLFIRVLPEMPMTGTYKLKKRDLQIQGYDLSKVKDPLCFLDGSGKYIPFTEQLFDDINEGKSRL